MNRHQVRLGILSWALALGCLAGPGVLAPAQDVPPPPPVDPGAAPIAAPSPDVPDVQAPPGMEILTRGPVHEAFAEPVVFDPKPGIVVPKPPPGPIEEIPPDQRPIGENVIWIPGYWSWDDDRNDFIWVSGVWRDVPPGQRWVPGYWNEVEGGFQWAPGFWAPEAQAPGAAPDATTTYLPPPPENLDAGPSGPPPSPDSTWIPGSWYWIDNRYAWMPGFWVENRPGWMWVPAHYVWTPSGYVFDNGYWDRPLDQRGMMFAPVAFQRPVYSQPNFSYVPAVAILAGGLTSSLFARPGYQHYYFGDYYAPQYAQSGIYPWFAFHQSQYGYDPLYSYYNANNGQTDPNWSNQLRRDYAYRRDHEDARPPRTFAAQQAFAASQPANPSVRNVVLAQPLSRLVSNPSPRIRLEKLDPQRHAEVKQSSRESRQFSDQRGRVERAAARDPRPEAPRAVQLNLPRPPIASPAPSERPRIAPPPRPEHPKPDPTIQPRPAGGPQLRPEPHERIIHPEPRAVAAPPPPRPEPPRPPSRPEPPRPRPEMRPEPARPKPEARPEPPRPKPEARPEPPRPEPRPRAEAPKPRPEPPKPGRP